MDSLGKLNSALKTVSDVRAKPSASNREKSDKADSADNGSTNSSSSSVNITSTTNRLQAMDAALAEVTIIDTKKVEQIRQAIAEGRFSVDPEAIADGLIRTSLESLRGKAS